MAFYVLKPDGGRFGTRWAFGDVLDPVHLGPTEACPVCGGPVSLRKWLPPHRLRLSSSRPEKWGTFVWGAGFDLIVSGQLKALYEAEGLSGIVRFYPPVEIVRAGNKRVDDLTTPPPAYHVVDIAWNGANLDDQASGTVRRRVDCPYDRGSIQSIERVIFEPGSWTGADIFVARGLPGQILVSERFRRLVESHRLGGALLIPAEKYAMDMERPGLWYVRED